MERASSATVASNPALGEKSQSYRPPCGPERASK